MASLSDFLLSSQEQDQHGNDDDDDKEQGSGEDDQTFQFHANVKMALDCNRQLQAMLASSIHELDYRIALLRERKSRYGRLQKERMGLLRNVVKKDPIGAMAAGVLKTSEASTRMTKYNSTESLSPIRDMPLPAVPPLLKEYLKKTNGSLNPSPFAYSTSTAEKFMGLSSTGGLGSSGSSVSVTPYRWSPFFTDLDGSQPPKETEECVQKARRELHYPRHLRFLKWLPKDRLQLAKAVSQANQKLYLHQIMEYHQLLVAWLEREKEQASLHQYMEMDEMTGKQQMEESARSPVMTCRASLQSSHSLVFDFISNWERQYGFSRIFEFYETSSSVSPLATLPITSSSHLLTFMRSGVEWLNRLPNESLQHNLIGLDWDKMAQTYFPNRSGLDCRIQWTVHDHPLINKKEWDKEESRLLQEKVKENGPHNWPIIAESLCTNRSAADCFILYQRKYNKSLLKSKWTVEEDALLRRAVKYFGERNWQQVASCLDGRTGQQCLHRWQKSISPAIKHGRWTREEDAQLIAAVRVHGFFKWSLIQQYVPGRTDVQCRERYMNVLHPNVQQGPWTEEEDEKLKMLVKKHGVGKWSLIASEIGMNRTDNQCWRRWKSLHTRGGGTAVAGSLKRPPIKEPLAPTPTTDKANRTVDLSPPSSLSPTCPARQSRRIRALRGIKRGRFIS